jgi:hypothetical protein
VLAHFINVAFHIRYLFIIKIQMPPRRRIQPVANAPAPDAYEREFGAQTTGGKKYCGAKNPPPEGRPRGTPNACFKAGIAVGARMGEATTTRKVKTARVAGEAAATARAKPKIKAAATKAKQAGIMMGSASKDAQVSKKLEKGIVGFQHKINIDKLKKDELRSIAVRLTNTPNALPGYSHMSEALLRAGLKERGYR